MDEDLCRRHSILPSPWRYPVQGTDDIGASPMGAFTGTKSRPISWWWSCRYRLRRTFDRLSVMVCDRHTISPAQIGHGQHDCALSSLYWAVPSVPEPTIIEAFNVATDTWPYGGVTNKEFAIALKYLKVDNHYATNISTLGELFAAKPAQCIVLLHGHFISIVDGKIVGHDADRHWPPETKVYCHWTFTRRAFRPA